MSVCPKAVTKGLSPSVWNRSGWTMADRVLCSPQRLESCSSTEKTVISAPNTVRMRAISRSAVQRFRGRSEFESELATVSIILKSSVIMFCKLKQWIIGDYGITVSTIEDVFMSVDHDKADHQKINGLTIISCEITVACGAESTRSTDNCSL